MSEVSVSRCLLEQVIEIMECNDPGQQVIGRLRAAAEAAQSSAEPVAWMHSDPGRVDVIHDAVRKLLKDSADSAGHLHRPLDKSERYTIPLYAQPTDSAALRDAAIAELVRRKMTSGNSVPVERCIITAAEIAAIAQQEAP